ncbi:MAG: PfkB family carbohydrate kinase [Nitrososphaerota archaeon]
MPRIAVVGHLTIDEIEIEGRSYTSMGGVACYVSLAARALGAGVKIFTRIGRDFPREYLRVLEEAGIDLSGVISGKDENSTRFKLTYTGDQRRLRLLSRAGSLSLEEIACELQSFDAVYLGPVAWEMNMDSIIELFSRVSRPVLDPQGLMRVADEMGLIELKKIDLEMLRPWILKLSREEAEVLTRSADPLEMLDRLMGVGAEITILTMGRLGSLVARGHEILKVPCYETTIFDSTGAGDVFGGAFTTSYLDSRDLWWAAAMASAMASIVVEGPSFKPLISPGVGEEAERRARIILERMERL